MKRASIIAVSVLFLSALAFLVHLRLRYGTVDACEAIAATTTDQLIRPPSAFDQVNEPALSAVKIKYRAAYAADTLANLRSTDGWAACYLSMAGLGSTHMDAIVAAENARRVQELREEIAKSARGGRP